MKIHNKRMVNVIINPLFFIGSTYYWDANYLFQAGTTTIYEQDMLIIYANKEENNDAH